MLVLRNLPRSWMFFPLKKESVVSIDLSTHLFISIRFEIGYFCMKFFFI